MTTFLYNILKQDGLIASLSTMLAPIIKFTTLSPFVGALIGIPLDLATPPKYKPHIATILISVGVIVAPIKLYNYLNMFPSTISKDDMKTVQFKHIIATREISRVILADFKNKEYAIKITTIIYGMSIAYNEYTILSCLDHPNIIKCIGTYNNNLKLYIFLEYYPMGTLDKYIETIRTSKSLLYTIGQIIDALEYIHQKNVMHLDLKPSNILIKKSAKKYNIVLADFGCSQIQKQNDPPLTEIYGFTTNYSPTEILLRKPYDGRKVDIFALGMILLEIDDRFENIYYPCTESDPLLRPSIEQIKAIYNQIST